MQRRVLSFVATGPFSEISVEKADGDNSFTVGELYEKAKELFEHKQWQAAAAYKSEDFDSALQLYSESDDLESLYNRANSLAKAQAFKEAIELYDQVINSQQPGKESVIDDAQHNKKIVEDLLREQQQKEQQEQQDQEKENQENQDSESESDSQSEQNSEEQSEQQENHLWCYL